jgi:hypothetical protein
MYSVFCIAPPMVKAQRTDSRRISTVKERGRSRSAPKGHTDLETAAGRPLPKKASGMEARQGGDAFGSVYDSPAPQADAKHEANLLICYISLI